MLIQERTVKKIKTKTRQQNYSCPYLHKLMAQQEKQLYLHQTKVTALQFSSHRMIVKIRKKEVTAKFLPLFTILREGSTRRHMNVAFCLHLELHLSVVNPAERDDRSLLCPSLSSLLQSPDSWR